MNKVAVLVKAENVALLHHLSRHLHDRTTRLVTAVAAAISAVVLNVLIARTLSTALIGTREMLDAAANSGTATESLHRAAAVLPFAISLGPAAVVLLLDLVTPLSSPLLLHARIAGTSRWSCGVARYLGQLAWGVVLSTALLVGGAWALASALADHPLRAFFGLMLMGALVASAATTTLTVCQSLGTPLLRSHESARALGLLAVSAGIGMMFTQILGEVTGHNSRLADSTRFWGSALPETPAALASLVIALLIVVGVGFIAARADASGGVIQDHRSTRSLPATGSATLDLVLSELVQVLREPLTRVSLATSVVIAVLLNLGVYRSGLHPGVAMMVVILTSSMGAETVHGRGLRTAWILRLSGLSPLRCALLRTGPYLVLSLVLLLVLGAPVALRFGGPLAWLEALSLFALTFTVALLAGTILPYDHQAPTGVAVTSVLTLTLEMVSVVSITWALRLQGWSLVLVNFVLATLVLGAAILLMARRLDESLT